MAYREKPEIYGELTRQERRERYYILWLAPLWALGPNLGRISHALGFRASYEVVFILTIAMALICFIGAFVSYKRARTQAARDLAELTGPSQ